MRSKGARQAKTEGRHVLVTSDELVTHTMCGLMKC